MYPLAHRAIGALMVVLPALAYAQDPVPEEENRPVRGAVGASFSYGRPVGDFLRYVDEGWGFDGFLRWNIEPQGVLSFKLDGGFLIYGNETKRVPLSTTVGARILVDLTTSNNIAWMGFGPQLTVPVGPFRPYGSASIGFSYFFTQSSVEGSDDSFDFANTTNFSDVTFRYGFGWGVMIPFQNGKTEWAIDLGAIYHGNGKVLYLREGGIQDLPGGSIVLHPIQSDANLLTYRLGFSVVIL
jgi:outer membrane protein with beta-barrel domain